MIRTGLFQSMFVVLAGAGLLSCVAQDDATSTLSAEEGILAQVFTGKVVNPAGVPISGARVTINGIVRNTSATGTYAVSIADSPAGYRIDIRKNGFGPATEVRVAGALDLVHRLQTGSTLTVPQSGGTVRDPASGISITVPGNPSTIFRTATGAPPAGTVRLTVIPHSSQTMPGDFSARRANGSPVALISVGAVTLQAVDAQNNPLGFSSTGSLGVVLPVPASAGPAMPACVLNGSCVTKIWRFDPVTSLWIESTNAAPTFGTTATTFNAAPPRQSGPIDPADGLGTWNADIEFTNPACVVIEYSAIPLTCYNPTGATPEPGISTTFTQALAGGGTKSKTSDVRSSAAFLVLYNLRANVDVDFSFSFPAGAPANCATNLTITSTPLPAAGFPVATPTGGDTRVSSGAPWGGSGYPTDGGGSFIDLADVVANTHPCNSKVTITTF